MVQKNVPFPNVLTDKPITFAFDPDTGIVLMTILGGGEYFHPLLKQKQEIQLTLQVGLTPESSRALLAALPSLQSILEQATKGPATPGSVQ